MNLDARNILHRLTALAGEVLEGTALPDLLSEAAWLVADDIPVGCCEVLEYRKEDRILLLLAGVGVARALIGSAVIFAGEGTHEERALGSAEPVLIEHLGVQGTDRAPWALYPAACGLYARIPTREGPFGLLRALSTQPDAFSPAHHYHLKAIAQVIGLAVEIDRGDRRSDRRSDRRGDQPEWRRAPA